MSTANLAKHNMIEQQIRPWEVLDSRVLSTLEQLNRVDFVAEPYRGLAYADCQIPLGNGVKMLPPTVEGRMLQALLIQPDDEVLEVGCGSGYISACLGHLAGQVTSVDTLDELVAQAAQNLAASGIDNVEFLSQSFRDLGNDRHFDVIAVTGSLPSVPDQLKQLLNNGGRLFVVVGDSPVMQALLVTRVSDNEWTTQSLFETDLPRLID